MIEHANTKTMLNVPNPAPGTPRVVGPPELVIAERDALATEIDRLRARVAAVLALCDERDGLTYGDTPHPGYVDTDEVRAALATPVADDPTTEE